MTFPAVGSEPAFETASVEVKTLVVLC